MITPLEGRDIAGQKLIEKYGREYLTENIKKLNFVEHVENGVLTVSFGIFNQDYDSYPSVERNGGIYVEEKNFPSPLMSVSVDLKNGTANIIEE